MVKFGRQVQQLGMNISLRQLGPGEERYSNLKLMERMGERAMLRTTGDGQGTRATGEAVGIRAHHDATQQGDPPCRTYRPVNKVSILRACCRICKVACHQAVLIAGCAIKKNSNYQIFYQWARGHGREKERASCGCAINLGMAVPCHHWPDMLQFLDSPVTDVTFKASCGNKVERSRYGIAGFFWPGSEPPAMGDAPVLLEG
ncbi:hypothetical protein CSKR_103011 [Clonorchis sinensis]|uniref:Uncharacterized protein n=1 Tax=Clonorchis sinensis TaxID=79923 RepID=A0A3R7GPR9_CLOSI|nr:hypothetical protein CSKR_103011 [Clonorchis sinensis]